MFRKLQIAVALVAVGSSVAMATAVNANAYTSGGNGTVLLSSSGTLGFYNVKADCSSTVPLADAYTSVSGGWTGIETTYNTVGWSSLGVLGSNETAIVTWTLYWWNGKWNPWLHRSDSVTISSPYNYGGSMFGNNLGTTFSNLPHGYYYMMSAAVTWTQNGKTLGSGYYGFAPIVTDSSTTGYIAPDGNTFCYIP
jgi:hypothetical protein